MKANRAFRSDKAVSPVIGVILMVAVTVVLAATVYVWVSSQDARSAESPGAFALTSAGNVANPAPGDYSKEFTLVAAMPGFTYGQLAITLDGAPLQAELGLACDPSVTGAWSVCAGTAPRDASSPLSAGDALKLRVSSSPSGATLRFLDPASNSVLYTVTIA
jgi:flagellin-like protein